MIWASSRALGLPRMTRANWAVGWTARVPPTVAIDKGRLNSPSSLAWSAERVHWLRPRYCPSRAAWAWTPASTARQSLPVASKTASTPFIMPLLWVTARRGSNWATRLAWLKRLARVKACAGLAWSWETGKLTWALTRSLSPWLERIRRRAWPPRLASTSGARASRTVFMTLAPMASQGSRLK